MTRSIKLLGGKSDILGILGIMDTALSEGEAVEETLKLIKCWNNNVEKLHLAIPDNPLYLSLKEQPCS
jgi:hypothetical protein